MHSPNYYRDKAAFQRKAPFLSARAAISRAFREWFAKRGFDEVDTPILQLSPGMEVHLSAFETRFDDITRAEGRPLMLHTSPEFAMKKLLGYGMTRIYQFAHVFRNEIASPTHYPEFTMLEWYRANEDYTALMDDCAELMRAALAAAGADGFSRGEAKCPIGGGVEKLSVAEAVSRYCGFDIFAVSNDAAAIKKEAARLGVNTTQNDTWDDAFEKIMMARVEPRLGAGRPTILREYPLHMAALSAPSERDPRAAERFELYICGVEIANAFTELVDADEMMRRFSRDMAEKKRLYGKEYPIDFDFVEAVADMPKAAGIALGFDRLAMLCTNASDIRDVMWSEIPGI
jgi:lysyl-tRNA synthetase class 2